MESFRFIILTFNYRFHVSRANHEPRKLCRKRSIVWESVETIRLRRCILEMWVYSAKCANLISYRERYSQAWTRLIASFKPFSVLNYIHISDILFLDSHSNLGACWSPIFCVELEIELNIQRVSALSLLYYLLNRSFSNSFYRVSLFMMLALRPLTS